MPIHALSPSKQLPAKVQQRLAKRFVRHSAIVVGLLVIALSIGATGYHFLNDLPWLDAYLNASMILTGMGPVAPLIRPSAKIFAMVYAIVSGVFFVTMVAVLLAPAVQGFLHRFHLELDEARRDSKRDDGK